MSDVDTSTPADSAPKSERKLSVVALWVSEASKLRIGAAIAAEIVDEIDQIGAADVVAVSTRIPKVRIERVMNTITDGSTCPIIAVCHAGGEETAVELMQLGAWAIVAEGNEGELINVLPDATAPAAADDIIEEVKPDGLLTTFAQRLETATSGSSSNRVRDPVTGLPTSSAFELRFAELSQQGQVPRLCFLRVANATETLDELDRETLDLLRRRLTMLITSVTNRFEAELFDLGPAEFALLARRLSPKRADELGEQIVQITEAFTPMGSDSLRLGFGHAGSEVASEPRTLRDLAQRAVEAGVLAGGIVVSADDMTKSQASTTELDAALRLAKKVDQADVKTDDHSSRVADYSVEIAGELGIDGLELVTLRLACLLHDVGKIGLDPEMDDDSDEYRSHPVKGEFYARVSSGDEVAAAVRSHHEWWDGTGFPDGLSTRRSRSSPASSPSPTPTTG